jgi:hypothetical protein
MEQTRFVDNFFEGPQLLSDIRNDFFICLENEHLHCKDVSTFYSVYLLIISAGLLLVAPHLFVVPVSVLWVGLQKYI